MSEEEQPTISDKAEDFEYLILTPEAKISILYSMLTDLETQLYQYSFEEPLLEDPNHPEWEFNYKSLMLEVNRLRTEFDKLGGNYDFNRMKKS